MIETDEKIVIIGGWNPIGGSQNKILEAEILPDGSIGPWVENSLAQLPRTVFRSGVTKVDNFIISVGGIDNGIYFTDVYYSEIQPDGSLGSWITSSNSLPIALCCGSLASTDTHLYYTGGHDGSSYFSNVYMAPFGEITEGLIVPDIKQYSPPWNDDEYDTASIWSSIPTIERWGCALTSASMVLQYHNHDIIPNELNNWLNSQSDGYLRNGLLNWLAISRYSRLNSDLDSPSLEFRRYSANDETLRNEIDSGRPAIFKIPGHFAVAKAISGSDFLVNDPASSTNSLLTEVETDHGGSYSQINSYIPSSTDLSYIMLVINYGYNINLFDQNGTEILGDYYIDEPLTDDVEGIPGNSESLGIYLFPKPENGSYEVQISGPIGNYQLDTYIYDQDGNVNFSESLGTLGESESDTYLINLNKINSEESSISEVSFESLLNDLDEAYGEGIITKKGVYFLLRALIQAAKRSYESGRIHASKILLNVAKKEIIKVTPRFIEQETSLYLQTKINLLLEGI